MPCKVLYACVRLYFPKMATPKYTFPHHPLLTSSYNVHQGGGWGWGSYITSQWIWAGLRLLQKWYCQASKTVLKAIQLLHGFFSDTQLGSPEIPWKEIWLLLSHHAEEILWRKYRAREMPGAPAVLAPSCLGLLSPGTTYVDTCMSFLVIAVSSL